MSDLQFTNEGTIILVEALTEQGQAWLDAYVDPDATRWGKAIVFEPHYARDLCQGALADGLTCE